MVDQTPNVTGRVVAAAIIGVGLLALVPMNTGWFGDRLAWATVLPADLAVLTAVVSCAGLASRRWAPEAPTQTAPGLADDLAATLEETHLREAQGRGLSGPDGLIGVSWGGGRTDGSLDVVAAELARHYGDVRSGRMLVLGEPGCGKSALALLLALGLLRERASGAPVPVLLSLCSWDPVSSTLDAWIVQALADAHYNGRPDIPRLLYDRALVTPVLDGLDELPQASQGLAVRTINEAISRQRPVVVTCRLAEYHDVVRDGGPHLARAVVIEVDPLHPGDVIDYLGGLAWPDGTTWDKVFEELVHAPDAPVARALSTPLMVSLARLVYQRLGGDPAELLDQTRFDSRLALEDQLTDQVVDAVYEPDHLPSGAPHGPAPRWSADEARRWLTFLAKYLHRHDERDLVWSRFSARLLSPWVVPAFAVAGGLGLLGLGAVAATFVFPAESAGGTQRLLLWGAGICAGFAALTMVVWYALPSPAPGRLSLRRTGSAGRLSRGFGVGLRLGAIPAVPAVLFEALALSIDRYGWSIADVVRFTQVVAVSLAVSLALGAVLAVHAWFDAPPERAGLAGPDLSLREDRRAALVGALTAGSLLGALAAPAVVAGAVGGSLAAQWATDWPGRPGQARPGVAVELVWQAVRARLHGAGPLTAAFAVPGLTFGLLVLIAHAWPRFALTRAVLAGRGELPWRLMAFLADARQRELLRLSAGSYQFRHVRLQQRLVNADAVDRLGDAAAPGRTGARGGRRPRPRLSLAVSAVLVAFVGGGTAALPRDVAETVFAVGAPVGLELQYSATGRTLVTTHVVDQQTNQKIVRRWDLSTGRQIGPDVRCDELFLSPATGALLALTAAEGRPAAAGYSAEVWNEDGRRGVGPLHSITGAQLSPTGAALLTYSAVARTARLWDTTTGVPVGPPIRDVLGAAFTADGAAAVTVPADGRRLQFWGVTRAEPLSHGTGRPRPGTAAELWRLREEDASGLGAWGVLADLGGRVMVSLTPEDPDDRSSGDHAPDDPASRVQGGGTAVARLWGALSGEPLGTALAHAQSAMFSPDGTTVVVDVDDGKVLERRDATTFVHSVHVLDAASGAPVGPVLGDATVETYLTPDRMMARIGDAGTFRVRDVRSGRTVFETTADGPLGIDLDGRLFATQSFVTQSADGPAQEHEVQVWDLTTGRPYGRPVHATQAELSPGGARLITHESSSLRLRDARTLAPLAPSVEDNETWQFSPRGHLVVTYGGDHDARVWDTSTGALVRRLSGHTGPVTGVAFSPDERRLVTSSSDGTARLWQLRPGDPHDA